MGSEKALETAKMNIENKFLTVGVLEDLQMLLTVLECLVPEYFDVSFLSIINI